MEPIPSITTVMLATSLAPDSCLTILGKLNALLIALLELLCVRRRASDDRELAFHGSCRR